MAAVNDASATAVGTSILPFPFVRRNLASSFPSLCPRSVLLPPCFPPLVAWSMRFANDDKRFSPVSLKHHGCVFLAASAAGSPQFNTGEDENPYEILGINVLDAFDQVKMSYKLRRKDAERSGDADYLLKLEKAYDTVMMEQLQNRKKGMACGSTQVSKDIKYADNQPIVPWGPRYSRSTTKDLRINMAISAAFALWCLPAVILAAFFFRFPTTIYVMCIATMRHADWKPLQFLSFAYFYRIIEKLKTTEPAITPVYNEYGEVEGRGVHMAKRVLRGLGLVLGSIMAASLGYTGLANFSQFLGHYIPSVVYNFQELIVTTASSVLLCILASYYR